MDYANRFDRALAGVSESREADWRNGAVIYQVLVDRFAPSADLEAKRHLYPAPKRLREWHEVPHQGEYLDAHTLWSHEIDFWGGDLASTAAHLGHVQQLGADVLYLNPICLAYTNHKYDALDYLQVSPEYGTREDVKALAEQTHRLGMKLVLDGVFNHMGRNSPLFRQAEAEAGTGEHEAAPGSARAARGASTYRDWFVFDPTLPGGARVWWRAQNLPELNLENPAVRAHLWESPESVVRSYLRDGIDGWRLDVAFDIGFRWLEELTHAAHDEKPGSLVVGEIANYPAEWYPSVDSVMLFIVRKLTIALANGQLDALTYGRMVGRIVEDCGIDNALKNWLYLENHDTPRLATAVPDERSRRLAQVLQFTLPGAPNLYYGGELDMPGGDDPEMRAPMRWDEVEAGHPALAWTRRLCTLRREARALRIGNYRPISTRELLAFERHTDRAADTVLVLVNPSEREVSETVMVANSKLMDSTRMVELLRSDAGAPFVMNAALMPVTLPPKGYAVLQPDVAPLGGYTNYKRVQ